MVDLSGKKLLIIGGAFQHCKLVEAAKKLGVITYVTDYLPVENAPAKQMADKYFMHNITDIDDIVAMCKEEKIDGVISTSLDACQIPYQQVCEKLGVPCFGNREQFHILTDKTAFKNACKKYGVDIIPEYCVEDFEDKAACNEKVEFPVFIKPCVSRGSRGQSVCRSFDEVKQAIPFAQSESANGEVVIEKYMEGYPDFSMTLLVVNGKAHPFRTVDRVLGLPQDGLDKLAVASASPSTYTNVYMKSTHRHVQDMLAGIGLVNAPAFMQGFVDGDTVRFYDPGLRLPGGEFERMFEVACGKNPLYPLIEFALTGQVSEDSVTLNDEDIWVNDKVIAQILPTLKAGKIASIEGMDEIRKHPKVITAFERFAVGDEIFPTHNVNQRFAEIDLVCDSNEELKQVADWIYDTLKITDENGNDMWISKRDSNYFLEHKVERE